MFEEIISYIKDNDFDILHLQEVGAGRLSRSGFDNFSEIKKRLGYKGELALPWDIKNDKQTYTGNATFYKSTFDYAKKEVVSLKSFCSIEKYIENNDQFIKDLPKNALALQFVFGTQPIWFINTHLAWGPNPKDEPYKVEQGLKLRDYLATLTEPFVLSGDFNVVKSSAVVKAIDELAVNHAVEAHITNTLNPRLHRAKQLFPAGLAVDFIYTTKDLQTSGFDLVDTPDLSDHFGLRIDLKI